jgi:hypothetical protein
VRTIVPAGAPRCHGSGQVGGADAGTTPELTPPADHAVNHEARKKLEAEVG